MNDLETNRHNSRNIQLHEDFDELISVKIHLKRLLLKYHPYLNEEKVQKALRPFSACSIELAQPPNLPILPRVRTNTTPLYIETLDQKRFCLEPDNSWTNLFSNLSHRLSQTVTALTAGMTRYLNMSSLALLSVKELDIETYGDHKETAINDCYRLVQYGIASQGGRPKILWRQVDDDFKALQKHYHHKRRTIQHKFLKEALRSYDIPNTDYTIINSFDIDYHHGRLRHSVNSDQQEIAQRLQTRLLDYYEQYRLFEPPTNRQLYLNSARDYLTLGLCVTIPALFVLYAGSVISTILPVFAVTLSLVTICQDGLGDNLARLLSSLYHGRSPSHTTVNALGSLAFASVINSFLAHSAWAISTVCYKIYYVMSSLYTSFMAAPAATNTASQVPDGPFSRPQNYNLTSPLSNNETNTSANHRLQKHQARIDCLRTAIYNTFAKYECRGEEIKPLMVNCYLLAQKLEQHLSKPELEDKDHINEQFNTIHQNFTEIQQNQSSNGTQQVTSSYHKPEDEQLLSDLSDLIIGLQHTLQHITGAKHHESSHHLSTHQFQFFTFNQRFLSNNHCYQPLNKLHPDTFRPSAWRINILPCPVGQSLEARHLVMGFYRRADRPCTLNPSTGFFKNC